MNNFIPTSEHNYEVTVAYSDIPVYFETFKEADHFARLNAGTIINLTTYEVVRAYVEDYEN